ncbi:YciI family protein [Actinomycetospora soli]|uniref:YciI family protein n=1 Tax=Actinomycetospora soli TaxID=2893887 RepID=UPI001E34C7A5|nr:YciI family protein [Actinomycetospora soli]MCD2191157.1 YciI family protein [Actinomycetospora soli]
MLRLLGPRPDFAQTLTVEVREVMGRHAAHCRPYIDSGQMVVFGPVLDDSGSYGLGVVETDDEEALRAFAAADPVVTTGTAQLLVGTMLAGIVRPR